MSGQTPTELLTLDRRHPDFEKYIWGTFSKKKRALAVQSLNVNSEREQVTFEIRDLQAITPPTWHEVARDILKIKNLGLLLFPLCLVLIKNLIVRAPISPILALSSALGALCLMMAVNFANDVQDHVRGLDRILPYAGGRAIQKGWLTAAQLYRMSYLSALAGIVFGLPGIYFFPEILWTIVPLAGLGLIGLLSYKVGLKYRAWSEWVVFLMVGPLLTVGYQLSFGGGIDLNAIFIGVLTGWLGVFLLHLRNWKHLFVNSQAHFDNSVVLFGFEKSRKFIIYWWIGFVVLLVTYHTVFAAGPWLWLIAVATTLASLPLIAALSDVGSPLGSGVNRAVYVAHRVVMFVGSLWFLEALYFLTEIF